MTWKEKKKKKKSPTHIEMESGEDRERGKWDFGDLWKEEEPFLNLGANGLFALSSASLSLYRSTLLRLCQWRME